MEQKRLRITMFSSADSVAGQGVGSAYEEQVRLIEEGAPDLFDVEINKWNRKCEIQHFHTIDPQFLIKMQNKKTANIAYCHFLPDTLEGSLRIPKMFASTASSYILNFYKSADRLVVVNPSFIDELVNYGIEREKIYYIPNFVSKETFHHYPLSDRYEWRMKYNIPLDAFVVIGCGQVQTRKGVKDFVETAKMLPDVQFVWAGGFSFGAMTEGYDELKDIMENPPENVTFTGIVERKDMVHLYNMSDVLFMPSYAELFPMTILEAVNLSKPLVLRNLDLYENILFEDYLKGENNEDFGRLIRMLQQDEEAYQKAAACSDRIADFYSKEHVLDMWKKFYTEAWEEKKQSMRSFEDEAL